MPYTVEKRGTEWCVYKGEPGRPTGDTLGCHDSEGAAKRQIQAIGAASHAGADVAEAEAFDGWVPLDAMRQMCPECADTMEARGYSRVNLFAIPGGMNPAMAQGLCRKFMPDPGFFRACMRSSLGGFAPSSKESFCAALHKYCTGIWPGAHGAVMTPDYLLDQFVSVVPGEPFRLFPFGQIIKGGETIDITPELAGAFKLPHFRPPIKLGGHDDDAPAGGHLIGLEVRDDGLYGLPEWTERGTSVVTGGDYRYQSPEVIWEGAGFEDPTTGDLIEGPLIVGVALLHKPHLGEAAALYSVEVQRSEPMSDIAVPAPVWDKIWERLFPSRAEPEPDSPAGEPEATVAAEQFAAVEAERDKLEAELQDIKAEKVKAERLAHFAAELVETSYAENAESHAVLAGMTEERAAWTVQQFKALSAQIKESALLGELGKTGETIDPNADPLELFDAAVKQKVADSEGALNYNAAVPKVAEEQPELYAAAYPRRKR